MAQSQTLAQTDDTSSRHKVVGYLSATGDSCVITSLHHSTPITSKSHPHLHVTQRDATGQLAPGTNQSSWLKKLESLASVLNTTQKLWCGGGDVGNPWTLNWTDPYTILYSIFSYKVLCNAKCVCVSLVERYCYWVKFPILTFTMVGELELPLRKDRK